MNKPVNERAETLLSADARAIQALARAQASMGKALKDSNNPHFKSKYADLASVRAAAVPALNENGFAVIQVDGRDGEGADFVETVFAHDSGHQFQTRIYLRGQLGDMQKYGSAATYARRYGLMHLSGLAPEDDDGNAASQAVVASAQRDDDRITEREFIHLRDRIEAEGVDLPKMLNFFGVRTLPELPSSRYVEAVKMLDARKKAGASND